MLLNNLSSIPGDRWGPGLSHLLRLFQLIHFQLASKPFPLSPGTTLLSLHILGLGTAVPAHTMSMQEATQLAVDVFARSERQQRLIQVLYKKSGVRNRHTVLPHRIAMQWVTPQGDESSKTDSVGYGPTTEERMAFYEEHAPGLARQAVGRALEDSGVAPIEITHLVTVSCTGFGSPGVDIDLIQHFSFRPTTQRVHVGFMGCHGAVNGIRTCKAFGDADPNARILLCAVECCSLHYRFQFDPELMLGNALFADGCAALVFAGDQSSTQYPQVTDTGCCLIPDSADAMTWKVGNHGFEMFLSAQIPELIESNLRPWLVEWLGGQGLALEDIQGWAVHPGGPRILQAVQDVLELSDEDLATSRKVLAEFGNMSSPTILFILERMRKQVPCVALGFGPGLMAEATLFQ